MDDFLRGIAIREWSSDKNRIKSMAAQYNVPIGSIRLLSEFIEKARKRMGWTVQDLADATGTEIHYMRNMQSRTTYLTPEDVELLAGAFRTSREVILVIAGYL